MIIETHKIISIDTVYDEQGNQIGEERHELEVYDLFADEGKVFARKEDGIKLSNHITLGTEDSLDNYEEVDL